MSEFVFSGMTPELQSYLDFQGTYGEKRALGEALPKGLLKSYAEELKQWRFRPDNIDLDKRKIVLSENGAYRLQIDQFSCGGNFWSYSQGQVYRTADDELLATVQRNYPAFPRCFVTGHPSGHDFLVCGEDYQGQTVIDLSTKERRDHLPTQGEPGHGFCWAAIRYLPEWNVLAVEGCYWGGSYEHRFYDFAKPLEGWPEIEPEETIDDDEIPPVILPDGTLQCYGARRDESDNDDEEDPPPRIVSKKTFRREGQKLVLLEEWVSDEEKAWRDAYARWEEKEKAWNTTFTTTDPLYLSFHRHREDPLFAAQTYQYTSHVHEGWCPDFTAQEKTWGAKIVQKPELAIDLEWAVLTGPIKLVVKRNKETDIFWFEHSVDGMDRAFAKAKEVAA
jgi:hypothetical protein